ncbi:MAG: T9SS type A sorting domain-containing protein [Bacteroidota bacterium]
MVLLPIFSSAQIAAPIRPGWVHFFAHSDSLHEDATDIDYAVRFISGPTLQVTDTLYDFNRVIRRCTECPPAYDENADFVPTYLTRASHFMGERYRAKTGRYVFEGPHKLQLLADATPGSFFTLDPVNLTAAEYVARYDTLVFGQPDTVARIRAPWGDFLISDTYGLLQWPDTSGEFSWQCIGIRGPDVGIQYPRAQEVYSQWQPGAIFKTGFDQCISFWGCDINYETKRIEVLDVNWITPDSGYYVYNWKSRRFYKPEWNPTHSGNTTYGSGEQDTAWFSTINSTLPYPNEFIETRCGHFTAPLKRLPSGRLGILSPKSQPDSPIFPVLDSDSSLIKFLSTGGYNGNGPTPFPPADTSSGLPGSGAYLTEYFHVEIGFGVIDVFADGQHTEIACMLPRIIAAQTADTSFGDITLDRPDELADETTPLLLENPVRDHQLQLTNHNHQAILLELIELTGRRLQSFTAQPGRNSHPLNVASGVYLLKSTDGRWVRRVVVR